MTSRIQPSPSARTAANPPSSAPSAACAHHASSPAHTKTSTPTEEKHDRILGRAKRRPSKRWQAFYTGPDTALHYAPSTFETKLDAEAWLTDERRLIAPGNRMLAAATGATLAELMARIGHSSKALR